MPLICIVEFLFGELLPKTHMNWSKIALNLKLVRQKEKKLPWPPSAVWVWQSFFINWKNRDFRVPLFCNMAIKILHKNVCAKTNKNIGYWLMLNLHFCVGAHHDRSITFYQPQLCICTLLSALQSWLHMLTQSHILFCQALSELNTNTETWLGEPQGLGLMTNKLSVCTNISAPQMKYGFSPIPKADR